MTSGMKETSSPWMPEVPESWTVLPARYCVTSRQNGSWGESPLNEGEGEFCLRAADFDYEHLGLKPRESFTRRVYSEAEFERVKVRRGDLIVEKSGGGEKTPVGRAVLIKNTIDVAFSNFLERLTVDSLKCIPEFFAYWWTAGYQSASFVPFFNQTTGIQNLNTTKLLASNVIALPESEEQYAIVELLDEECAKIDQAIDLLQQELDALEQLKKSIIYEAVTKGLDPAVPMKPSGVELIGEIPEHWGVKRLKYLCKMNSGTNLTSEEISETGDYPVYGGNGVRGYYSKFNNDASRVLVGRQGALCGNVQLGVAPFWATDHAVVVTELSGYGEKYAFYALTAMNLNRLSMTAAQPGLSVEKIICEFSPVPPSVGQESIVSALESKVVGIEAVLEIKYEQLEILKQKRQSIIFEYVTGKRRVNEVA